MSQQPPQAGNPGGPFPQGDQPHGAQNFGQPQPPQHNQFPGQPYAPQPNPGQPVFQPPAAKKKGKGCLIVIGVIVGILILGGIIGAINGGKSASSGTSTQAGAASQAGASGAKTTAPATTKAAEPAAPGLGTAVADEDLEFTITAFKCGVTVKTYKPLTPQGQFCQVDLTIKNTGKKQAMVTDNQINLLDAAGVEYSTSSDTLTADGTIFLQDVNPGNSFKGIAYFDVPKDVTPTTAVVKGGLFSKGKSIRLS